MIHPTAIIDPKAEIADSVSIGAYSVIGADVSIDEGTSVGPHVVIEGPTRIGKHNTIYQYASLGAAPQDKKYGGEPTELIIGDHNTIREFCTFNRGTVQDNGQTVLGSHNWIMAYVHIAHDCVIGNHTIFANNASLAGHVHIDDYVMLGGFALVYQFTHIGRHAICAFSAGVKQNVPPYAMVAGMPAKAAGLNLEGLRRHGFSAHEVSAIKQAHKLLYREGLLLSEARTRIQALAEEEAVVQPIAAFLAETGKRGLIR
ncbi:acyl-ACP--UDP-N-acetylglucosamine O-acyltransferase [Suttonella sp. R2A3]|uniref:acyl-ACP--UDP-N-acetylglucosamine O-acyltransferase n=1 Tax=Suttonella sp. R2A3 TaxID=2908648 RepID=UPI001F3A1216|nr:acyl-ACP--UDP-N-acetylglucosamine O-acyltransferase [Suttonella sp. R2A3]UJF24826.1 acyl-ACP--UDP-N-acetylglucosamine O-acyltransferase [Suttonella sp. R2A3]